MEKSHLGKEVVRNKSMYSHKLAESVIISIAQIKIISYIYWQVLYLDINRKEDQHNTKN